MELFVKVILWTEVVLFACTMLAMAIGRPEVITQRTRFLSAALQIAVIVWAARLLYGR